MGETLPTASKSKPTIMVPPRGFLFATGPSPGFSPGPMTLVSNYFPEQSPFSFSQLLALASPLTPKAGFLPTYDSESLADKPAAEAAAPPQLESITPLFMLPPGLSPTGLMNSPGYLSPLHGSFGMSHQQALAHVTAQAALSQSFKQMQAEYQHSSSANLGELAPNSSAPIQLEALVNPTAMETESSKKALSEVSQSDKRIANVAGDKPASDGYNWRKYGQKQVKASECPRSYYKCTHLNCPVKKKVERSLDGRSEITYKGQHNHDPPKPNKREKDSSDRPANSHVKHVSTSQFQIETERLKEAVNVDSEPATSQQPSEHHLLINRNDNTKDNVVVADEDDSTEPAAKRRSLDSGVSVPTTSSQQTTSDSKIVLQTRSAVDLLDDGYKWRKYGQKVVKGNSHPRSYYRCTYSGCNVRKHVERSSADPKSVITTYEGTHNHDIPVGRYSAANASSQSIKVQKVVSKNTSIDRETDYGNRDQMPTTLQLKGEQVAA